MRRWITALAVVLGCVGAAVNAAEPEISRELLNAVLWTQTASEYRAVSRGTYLAAKAQLAPLKHARSSASPDQLGSGAAFRGKIPAVVLDIDETVLDNSAYQALLVKDGKQYDVAGYRWSDWVRAGVATGIDGAAEFVGEARRLGIAVIFVTNRVCDATGGYGADGEILQCPEEEATLRNLERILGYMPSDSEVLLRNERETWKDSDKTQRRLDVAERFRIVMLVGDNIEDFVRKKHYSEAAYKGHWGMDWFALPNAMYGSWEDGRREVPQKYATLQPWEREKKDVPALASIEGLRLVSWNLEWLADPARLQAAFWGPCRAAGWPSSTKMADDLPFCDVYRRDGIESAMDYETHKLVPARASLASLASDGMDVLAVQEVQGPAALAAVLPEGYSVLCFTTRQDAQNVGYAVRTELRSALTCQEVRSLSLEDEPGTRGVRRGLELTINRDAGAIAILNVHLKASCPKGRMDRMDSNCQTLQKQARPLEAWIESQAKAARAFLIIGDWNRDIEEEVKNSFPARSDNSNPSGPIDPRKVRNLYPELNDAVPPSTAMRLATIERSAASASECHKDLDQMVLSEMLLAKLKPNSLLGNSLTATMVAGEAGASDHCALATTLELQ